MFFSPKWNQVRRAYKEAWQTMLQARSNPCLEALQLQPCKEANLGIATGCRMMASWAQGALTRSRDFPGASGAWFPSTGRSPARCMSAEVLLPQRVAMFPGTRRVASTILPVWNLPLVFRSCADGYLGSRLAKLAGTRFLIGSCTAHAMDARLGFELRRVARAKGGAGKTTTQVDAVPIG